MNRKQLISEILLHSNDEFENINDVKDDSLATVSALDAFKLLAVNSDPGDVIAYDLYLVPYDIREAGIIT